MLDAVVASAGTAITSRLPAKTTGFSTRPSSNSWSGSLVLAAAYTSGLTPWRICAASSSEPAKLKRAVASSKLLAVVLERAVQRRRGRDRQARLGVAAGVAVVVAAAGSDQRQRGQQQPPARGASLAPRSTITEVAFTAAVAGTPGARPSSSTASRVTAAVTRCGPGLDLHQRHHAVDLHRAHDAGEAVARRQLVARAVALGAPAQALDLAPRDPAPVGRVAHRARACRRGPSGAGCRG